jgi:hypothetical protein
MMVAQIRDAAFNQFGTIDCEMLHPDLGWMPFTASPDDPEERGRLIFASLKDQAAPYLPPPPPTAAQIAAGQRAFAEAARAQAYATDADPLFFKAQRGEIPMQDWTQKVAEIRARYPYPED